MSFALFLSEAIVISLSGVMAPGPITAVAIGRGSRSLRAGPLVAIGHGIVEFPVMAAVALGVGRFLETRSVQAAIGATGAAVLALLGVGMLRLAPRRSEVTAAPDRSPLAAGVLLSLANPYFLIWWATIGAALIARSLAFGLAGLAAFGVAHWLCDFLWCSALSTLSFRGSRFFGGKTQRAVFMVCGAALLVFAVRLMIDAVTSLTG
jgi:threonine/homoserine/homoserine lactone efflux protein